MAALTELESTKEDNGFAGFKINDVPCLDLN
jgi:hypothetical protein